MITQKKYHKQPGSFILSKLTYILYLTSCTLFACAPKPAPVIPPETKPVSTPSPPLFARVKHPDQLQFSQIKFTIPKPERIELGNGLVIYLLEDHELPLIDVIVRIGTGSIYDPPDKSGLAYLTTRLMRTGGAGSMTSNALDKELESLGATLSATADYEKVNFSLSLLAEDIARGLRILSLVLRKPIFAEEDLKMEKEQLTEIFRRENDQPGYIALREFRSIIYPQHPYGQRIHGHPETIPGIIREDIVDFYTKYFTPQNTWLGIVGDFQTKRVLGLIRKNFGDWSAPHIDYLPDGQAGVRGQFPSRAPLERKYRKSVNLIPKESAQATLLLGHIGVKRLSPDYFPLILMNAILGGGSMSRLSHKIRLEQGLVYGINSYLTMPQDLGMFVIQTETQNQSVAKVLNLILAEVKRIREEPIKDEELKHTQEAIFNNFIFRFDNPIRIVDQYIYIESMGLPSDYLETYQDKIKKVTKEDILRVAREYLHPDELIYVVVGNDKQFDRPLSDFGPVNTITRLPAGRD